MWTKQTLRETIASRMEGYKLIIASNRQPFHHMLKAGKLICQREPGGVVTALHPVMQASSGTWIAAASTDYDRQTVDSQNKVKVPPDNPAYTLRRLFIPKMERDAYYFGYANQGLWPLCHIVYTRPVFRQAEWEAYQRVNRIFAQAIMEEAVGEKAFVWAHDFHLALVAQYLKEMGCQNIVTSLFWHIPWPNPEVFRICPQKKEILEGLLAYDLLGFQIRYHADNFFKSVDSELESRIDRETDTVNYQNRQTLIRAFPISVDFDGIGKKTEIPAAQAAMERLKEELDLGGRKLILGIDRIDYTKGLPEKVRAIDRFLEKYPDYKQKFVFLQIGQISRLHVQRYKQLNDELNGLVEEVNWKHAEDSWKPVHLTRAYFSYDDILVLYRMADICIVSSLHDGMNLVAKEFVSARTDESGVLMLSSFTGAARELTDALLMNPYDIESFADTLAQGLVMPEEEKQKRMRKMREAVSSRNIYHWAGKVLSQLLRFEFQEV